MHHMALQITGSECLRRECGYNGDHPSRDHGAPVTGVTLLSPHIVGAAPWPRRVSPPHPPSLFMCYHQSQYFQNKPRKLFLILHTSHTHKPILSYSIHQYFQNKLFLLINNTLHTVLDEHTASINMTVFSVYKRRSGQCDWS